MAQLHADELSMSEWLKACGLDATLEAQLADLGVEDPHDVTFLEAEDVHSLNLVDEQRTLLDACIQRLKGGDYMTPRVDGAGKHTAMGLAEFIISPSLPTSHTPAAALPCAPAVCAAILRRHPAARAPTAPAEHMPSSAVSGLAAPRPLLQCGRVLGSGQCARSQCPLRDGLASSS